MLYEAEVLEGLEPVAQGELARCFRGLWHLESLRRGAVTFDYDDDPRRFTVLRCVTAMYLVLRFPVPRPRGLLGHAFFSQLADGIAYVRSLAPVEAYRSLRVSAAGESTAVMQRLRQALADQTGIPAVDGDGDLLIRVRAAPQHDGWESLVRIGARPLAARSWRVCPMPGAMSAPLAAAMSVISAPRATDRVLNVCCGSGTLLIERLLAQDAYQTVGCDSNPEAIACARRNLAAADLSDLVHLELWDARELPLADASFDVVLADLPFGQLIGSHRENEQLYPMLLAEAARVAVPNARAVLLSHEVRLLEQTIHAQADRWALEQVLRVRSGGMMPGVFVLRRR